MFYAILAYHADDAFEPWTPEQDAALMKDLLTVHGRLVAEGAMGPAARLEGINKYFGTRLCVSGVTKEACQGIAFRPIVSAIVKGKTQALDLWEPLHEGGPAQSFLDSYMAAYDSMTAGDGSLFEALSQSTGDDYLVRLHVGRLKKGETGTELKMTEK